MSITEQNLQGTTKLNSIEDAINDIRFGKVVVVVDDENRENEGDFIAAAEKVTPEMINFMALHGRGLICAPLTETRCDELGLNMMVQNNTVLHNTQFTVSVDLIGNGCTTGISTSDRSKTIKALVEANTNPHDLGRPGHIFPLKAKNGGVLRRTGHTEAAVDLARLAGLQPAGILVEILNDDGSMARLPELRKVAEKFDLKIISIEDLVAYRMEHDSLIQKKQDYQIETRFGDFRLRAYQQTTNDAVHIALTKGTWSTNETVPTRINSTLQQPSSSSMHTSTMLLIHSRFHFSFSQENTVFTLTLSRSPMTCSAVRATSLPEQALPTHIFPSTWSKVSAREHRFCGVNVEKHFFTERTIGMSFVDAFQEARAFGPLSRKRCVQGSSAGGSTRFKEATLLFTMTDG